MLKNKKDKNLRSKFLLLKTKNYQLSNNFGFTLIELLVVIAIIGILSSVVMASLNGARAKARTAKAIAELGNIRTAMEVMEMDTGEWPGHQTPYSVCGACGSNEVEDITVASAGLTANDPITPYSGWRGPYINANIIDPWGHPYFLDTDYTVAGENAVALGSYGPDGIGLNLYNSDDIILILAQE